MIPPLGLPEWVPWWVPLAILVPLALYALAFLAMPFSVLGLKGRIEAIEGRLDEIQGEIRSLALRLPEPMRGGADPGWHGGFDQGRGSHWATPAADGEPPVMPRRPAGFDETAIPRASMRHPPTPQGIVPIPPVSREPGGANRPFNRPVAQSDDGMADPVRARPIAPTRGPDSTNAVSPPAPSSAGRRAEPRIDWPR